MHPLLQNKFIRFGLAGAGLLIVIFVVLTLLFIINNARSTELSMNMGYATGAAPMFENSIGFGESLSMSADGDMMMKAVSSSYRPAPEPVPDGYTAGLESYETTDYYINGRLKEFDNFCAEFTRLKADPNIHFKYLNESTNNCNATFYVAEERAEQTLSTLTTYKGIEFVRNTESVTRHRQQIQNQTSILEQQLASVSHSLATAEIQFDELADFARQSKDAAALSEAIRYKLQNIDNLTQRKINLTAQLNNLYQQSADLEERLNVVQFDVHVYRSNPINIGKYERQWEAAWEELKDQFTDTLIGLSAFFGIFLLWVFRIALYLIVLIVVLRAFWKFIKLLWRK